MASLNVNADHFDFAEGLSIREKSNFLEGHVGVVLGLLTVLFTDRACPDLIAEKDENLIGSFYVMRENGTYEFAPKSLGLTKRLLYDFDPKKLVCSKQFAQIQFMTKLVSQTLFLMDLAEIKVVLMLV